MSLKLFNTDKFIIQRPSTNVRSGLSSSDVYSISAEALGLWCADFAYGSFIEISDKVDFLETQVDSIINDYLPKLQTDLNLHDIAIDVLEDDVKNIKDDLKDTNVRIDDALSKAKINLYHKLVNDEDPQEGEMCVFKTSTSTGGQLASTFGEVVKIRYNIVDSDGTSTNFENVFKGETIEITNLQNAQSTLTHRAIFYITEAPATYLGTYIEFEVEARHSNGLVNDLPFYDEAKENPTRSDFYPIFTIQQEDVDDLMDGYLLKTGDTMTGKLSINATRSKLTLWGEQSSDFKFKTALFFNDADDNNVLELTSSVVKSKKKLNMNNNQIKSLAGPTEATDAATKEYVDESLAGFDVQAEDLFYPGDRVAETNAIKTEQYGFYFANGTLYFKTSA